jgi:ethylbenzene dioxygenase subunit beta
VAQSDERAVTSGAARKSTQKSGGIDDLVLIREIEEFLFHEARLLDDRQFEDWAALFADDGVYWVPMREGQESPLVEHSIFYDDRALLDVRVRRLQHPETYAQQPASRTRHLVGNVVLDREADAAAGETHVRSSLVMFEYRQDIQRVFGAETRHRLRRVDDGFRIILKRVDLVNCDAVHEFMSVPI